MLFGEVRRAALAQWIRGTGRQPEILEDEKYGGLVQFDDISKSHECRWQGEARRIRGDKDYHVPHFCSLGEWSMNISDILCDTRYDRLEMATHGHAGFADHRMLFRHYTRLLLVISEMINDFVDIEKAFLGNKSQGRGYLSNELNVNALMRFINNVCKHKAQSHKTGIHFHNHHLPIWFEEVGPVPSWAKPIGLKSKSSEDANLIAVPRLSSLIQVVVDGYNKTDERIAAHPDEFREFCVSAGRIL